MTVLIVDDEPSFRLLTKDYLGGQGIVAFAAADGPEALGILSKEKIDLVVSDLHMPFMDGIQFCRSARALPGLAELPFLFVSAYNDDSTLVIMSTFKNSGFLSKGRPMEELVDLIKFLTTPVDQGGGYTPAEVPQPPQAEAQPAGQALPRHDEPDRSSPARLLLVDDDDSLRTVLQTLLAKEGYTVTTAQDGEEAMKIIKDGAFDLVLLDIIMPKISGFGVLRFIKESAPSTRVIMLTAYSELKLAVEAKQHGADDFIGKPFIRADLLNTIRQVLQK